jgi:hypothetical protein
MLPVVIVVSAVLITGMMATRLFAQHTVTKVVAIAKPAHYTGPCPADIQFIATVFVSRHPVTIEYQWERSDHARGPRQRLEIRSAGQGIYDTWRLGARGQHLRVWQKLHVLAPTGISSAPAVAQLTCR